MDPQTPEEWLRLAKTHEITALLVAEDRLAASQAMFHAGSGVEAALKAYIMRQERLNGWPSKASRPELYTHDLRQLARIAGINVKNAGPRRPSWHVMFQWDRNQAYDPKPMPRRVARSFVEAAWSGRDCDMDQNDLGLSRYDAGAEYLKALRKLGLEPEALFWAHDSIIDRVILVLVTRVFDYAGPLELSKLLFKAYDSSATPREIDPFIIRVHSPFQKIYRELKTHLGNRIGHVGWSHEAYSRATIAREVEPAATYQMKYGSLTSFGSWVYKYSPEPKKVADSERVWNRFRQNVADAAA